MPEQTFEEKINKIKKNLGSWMPNHALQAEPEEGLDKLNELYMALTIELLNEIYDKNAYGDALDYICDLHHIKYQEVTDYFSERLLIR